MNDEYIKKISREYSKALTNQYDGVWNPLKWIECFAGLIFFGLAISLIFGGLH